MNDDIFQLSIRDLLSGRDDYIIPMYQRNYAWEEGEITQLIQDVIDYMPQENTEAQHYYIGTLVVFERSVSGKTVFEIIDGQQRLTTLSLLVSYLKNSEGIDLPWYKELKIHFESREKSRKSFTAIFEGKFNDDPAEVLQEKEINSSILNGYRLIKKLLPQKIQENNITYKTFTDYLFDMVQIMRVKVPHDTDLNHYFEIMNSRGEQLEKHEVLKSRLMKVLNDIEDVSEREQSQNCLHLVWEACANMERYVQMGFRPSQRNKIFGNEDWGQFNVSNFKELRGILTDSGDLSEVKISQTLDDIIANPPTNKDTVENDDGSPERFNTVINFQNFLLHVLRVLSREDIPLDDKRLIATFETHIFNSDKPIKRVKIFIFSLLKCKYLFDQYVIKREFVEGADRWSLKRLKWNKGDKRSKSGRASYVNTFGDDEESTGDNRRVLMLLSAFHVSTPTMVYKHWLNAALYHLFFAEEIQIQTYLSYLESVAKAFVFDRFLAEEGAEYFNMIFTNEGICQTTNESILDQQMAFWLSFDQLQNNLVFNFLDYLLWVKYQTKDSIVKAYEFTFRSSVEHYYPQKPMQGHEKLPPEILNSFGNLCLISHSKNSRLSNLSAQAKKDHYRVNTIDSIKQHLMMKFEHWNTDSINKHYDDMKVVLVRSLGEDKNNNSINRVSLD